MPKVLQMPKREYRDDQQNATRLPNLLSTENEEQSDTLTMIERWVRLADQVLGNQQTLKRA
jgi:hypothetical protein